MKNYLIISLLAFCFLPHWALSGGDNSPVGAPATAMGGIGIAFSDVFAAHNNQAALAFIESNSIGIYTERRFSGANLLRFNASAALKTKAGVFGLDLNYFGISAYNEQKVGISYARMLADRFSIAIQLDYLGINIEEFGSKAFATFEVGLFYGLTQDLSMAAHIYNPLRAQISEFEDDRTPAIMKLGLQYEPSEKVRVGLELEKDIDFDPVWRSGIEYQISDPVFLRAGYASNPDLFSAGVGFSWSQLQLDLAANWHQQLGVSPQLSLAYVLGKN